MDKSLRRQTVDFMPRPRICRRVFFEPSITYFGPRGNYSKDETLMTVDELESIRLKDMEGLEQKDAAEKMNISQPTFNRILSSARKKIAEAIVQGKPLRIGGGSFVLQNAPSSGFGRGRGFRRGAGMGMPPNLCKCPKCGYSEQKERGVPCSSVKCPKCGSLMMRGDLL